MENHTLKTTLGCVLAAIFIAGCEKNEAPQATGATDVAPLAAQVTRASPAAGQKPSTALSPDHASQIKAMDARLTASGCVAALDSAVARGASKVELSDISISEMCSNPE